MTIKKKPRTKCLLCLGPMPEDLHANSRYCSQFCADEVKRAKSRSREKEIRDGVYVPKGTFIKSNVLAPEDRVLPIEQILARRPWNKLIGEVE